MDKIEKNIPDNHMHVSEFIALCKDFSSCTGSIYIGDVEAALSGYLSAARTFANPTDSVSDDDLWHIATMSCVMSGGSLFDMSQNECVARIRASFCDPDTGREMVNAALSNPLTTKE